MPADARAAGAMSIVCLVYIPSTLVMVSTNLAGILADNAFIVARGGCSDAVGGRSAVR